MSTAEFLANQLEPPAGLAVEAWLAQYDSQPRLLPRWPESSRMTLVAVVPLSDMRDSPTAAYVLTRRAHADVAVGDIREPRTLFFTVPRVIVLSPEVRPATLTGASWET